MNELKLFPDDFPRVYLGREIDYIPYFIMSPIEIEELKNQLNDHLYKGFIRPRIYPLGAPVLFI